ncbi:hypothetical protein HII13_002930 [Brettanomyces bruxellensis]|nr:hypothetical protein HII13_002930 [Brettanomyces bruxellensis]
MKWSKEQQLLLLKRTCYHKPIGKHRNKELDTIVGELKKSFPELDVKKQDLIDELSKYYDLSGLEALEKEDEVFVEKQKPATKKKRSKMKAEKRTRIKSKEAISIKDNSDEETSEEDADESISSRLAKRQEKKKKRVSRSRSRRKVTITDTADNDANKADEGISRGRSRTVEVNDGKRNVKRNPSRSRRLRESSPNNQRENSDGKGSESETESDDNIGSRTRRRSLRESSRTPSINSSPVRRGRSRTPKDLPRSEVNDARRKDLPKEDDIVRRLKSRSRSKVQDLEEISDASTKGKKISKDDGEKGIVGNRSKTEDKVTEEEGEEEEDEDEEDEKTTKDSIASRTRRHQRSPPKGEASTVRMENRKHKGRSRK